MDGFCEQDSWSGNLKTSQISSKRELTIDSCRIQRGRLLTTGMRAFLEEEMAIHSGILAWKILWTEEPGGLQFMSLQRVRHDWATEQLSTSTNSLRNENSLPIHIIKHILTLFFSSLLLKRFITNKKRYQLIIVVSLYHIISNNTTTAKNFPWNLIAIKCLNAL